MSEGAPKNKKEKAGRTKGALFALGAALAAYGATELSPKEDVRHEQSGQDSSAPMNPGTRPETRQEELHHDEPAEALAAFQKGKQEHAIDGTVSYSEADRSIQAELRENLLQDYLRFHPHVFESIRNTFGGAPIIAAESGTVYVIADAWVLDSFGAYTGIQGETHLFDLTLTEKDGALKVTLRNPADALGLP